MRRGPRGGPCAWDVRLARANQLLTDGIDGAARDPLRVLAAVLTHQLRSGPGSAHASEHSQGQNGLVPAVEGLREVVPEPLREAGDRLAGLADSESAAVVETWIEDTSLVDPRIGFWILVAEGPGLEQAAAASTPPDDWQGSACPSCGGWAQVSVIAEESGEFMAGSPRSLVCGRCATWWPFRRATCVACGEGGVEGYLVEGRRYARVDTCDTCKGYIKTFDLREPGSVDVIPLVDDVATLTLDVWAQERGYARATSCIAGV